ncbi:hypothetical protein ABH922_004825 [Rhodococcus sp. 27YEA15]|uniref:hypothetical protein n=1 Tax=Rhodococcus sp. 27YEA15 TaxID=3156259 RepID=UPI003C7C25F0
MNETKVRPAASAGNFERLQRDPLFEELTDLIAEILTYAFDDPADVEIEKWTLSCLPSTNKSAGRRRLFTLNVGPMEVLSVECHLSRGQAIEHAMYIYLSSSALESHTGCSIEALNEKYDLLGITRSELASADGDGTVIECNIEDSDALAQFGQLPIDARTLRPLAERLVAKGRGPYRQYHNPGFAKHVLEGIGQLFDSESTSDA